LPKILFHTVVLLIALVSLWHPSRGAEDPAIVLRNNYQEFLAGDQRPADLPIQVFSADREGVLEAGTHAVLHRDFSSLAEILSSPANWCELVPVVLNVKACTWQAGANSTQLTFYVGRKFYEPPENAYKLKYDFILKAFRDDYFHIALVAEEGPHGTSDYLLEVEAIDISGKTFLAVHTSYRSSAISRLGTRGYLATLGRNKIGFTVTGGDADNPEYIQGIRGIVERNAVRYYLAFQAYLETQHLKPDLRFAAATELWYDLTEQFHDQLYEMDRAAYLDIKRRERIQQLHLQRETQRKQEKTSLTVPSPWNSILTRCIISLTVVMSAKRFSRTIGIGRNSCGSWSNQWKPTPLSCMDSY
jgi:hypothetical protein